MTVRKLFCKASLFALISLFCVFSFITPVHAARQGDDAVVQGYGLEFSLQFSEGGDHDLADYQENVFLIQHEGSGAYLKAEYDAAAGCYYVTGLTESEDEATRFVCGLAETDPVLIAIYGFESGSYIMRHSGVTEGYVLLRDGVSVTFSDNEAQLDNEVLSYKDSTANSKYAVVSFGIVVSKGFELPATCYACLISRHPLIIVWDALFLGVFGTALFFLIRSLIKNGRRKCDGRSNS